MRPRQKENTSDPLPSFASAVPTRPLPTRVKACKQTKSVMLLPREGRHTCGRTGACKTGRRLRTRAQITQSYLFHIGFLLCRYDCHGAALITPASCATCPFAFGTGVLRKLKPDRWSSAPFLSRYACQRDRCNRVPVNPQDQRRTRVQVYAGHNAERMLSLEHLCSITRALRRRPRSGAERSLLFLPPEDEPTA